MESKSNHVVDRELVLVALGGNEDAIETLVRRLHCIPRILSLLNQRVGGVLGPEDLGDLTQETLTRLWERLGSYDGRASLESWVYGFCFNGLMNAVRKEHRVRRLDAVPEPQTASTTPLPVALEYDHLHRSLEKLGERELRVIRMKYYDDLTFEEIGTHLGISPNTAKTCYYRGMRQLEDHLRRSGGGSEA